MCILCYMLNNPALSDGEVGKLLLKCNSKKIFLYKLLKINKVVLCYLLLKLVERNTWTSLSFIRIEEKICISNKYKQDMGRFLPMLETARKVVAFILIRKSIVRFSENVWQWTSNALILQINAAKHSWSEKCLTACASHSFIYTVDKVLFRKWLHSK